ncbi:MAG: alkaline phosphatase D family protein [Hydrogenophaga sp.]|jgi:hypothetical protein|nr:alkaline phosphatase D family protein [Hydrogenophaga sp.]
MRDIQRLLKQLSAPDEHPIWLQPADPSPSKVLALPDDDSSYVLVVWVQRGADNIALLPLGSEAPVQLQKRNPALGRQQFDVSAKPKGATHLLVMGWTRQRSADPPWTNQLFNHPIDLPSFISLVTFEALLPAISTEVLQGALNELLKNSPATIRSSLLEHSTPAGPALLTLAGASRTYSALASGKALFHEAAQTFWNHQTTNTVAPPAAQLRATRLIFASCQYPSGLLDHRLARASFQRMEDSAGNDPALGALLLLGDQIYADATYGILDPSVTSDRLALLYRDLRDSLKQYPVLYAMGSGAERRLFVTPDDHEISDNWEPGGSDNNGKALRVGMTAFEQLSASPLPGKQRHGGHWGAVNVGGGHQVFMLDTRTTRHPRPWGPGSGSLEPHILNEPQRQGLESWLRGRQQQDGAGPVSPKLISSPVWLLPRRVGRAVAPDDAASRSDSWDGYPASLDWLLGFIATEKIRGVVMLCGDAHLAGHTRVELKHNEHTVQLHILHAPALYAPFPFANGQPHHYRCLDDQWEWANGSISCCVDSELWALGDGFVHLSVVPVNGAWQVRATFDTGTSSGRSEFWAMN